VIRNPYSKLVDAFFCVENAFFKGNTDDDHNDPVAMNAWLIEQLKLFRSHTTLLKNNMVGQPEHEANSMGKVDLLFKKHLTPQLFYVYDADGNRTIKNVIHYEDMRSEFNSLMKDFDLPLKLPRRAARSGQTLTHLDLYPETITLINDIYRTDFEAFGYEMIDSFQASRAYSLRARSKPCQNYNMESNCRRDEQHQVIAKRDLDFPLKLPHATTFFLGISTEMTEEGERQRERIRNTYIGTGDARICSWNEFKQKNDASLGSLVECRVPFAFISIERNPDFINTQTSVVERKLVANETEIDVLIIDTTSEQDPSFAFYQWVSSIGFEYHIDFVSSVASTTLIDPKLLLKFIDIELPPAPLSRAVYGGEIEGTEEGYFAAEPFIFMSIDLATYIGERHSINHAGSQSHSALEIGKLMNFYSKPVKLINANPNLFWYKDIRDPKTWNDHWNSHMDQLPRKTKVNSKRVCKA